MSNTTEEAVPRFNISNLSSTSPPWSPPPLPALPPLPPLPAPTLPHRIPKNSEIVIPDSSDDDSTLSLSELCVKYRNDSAGLFHVLQARKAANEAAHPEELEGADRLLASITDADSFMRRTIPKPTELISGMLYQGDKMCLNAGSKIGKTWHLLRLGLSASEGLPWLGRATTKTRVLFVNFELKDFVTQDRVQMVKNDLFPNTDATNFDLLNLRDLGMRPETIASVLPDFADKIKDRGYGMIIFDPIYKMYGWDMDENSAGDVTHLLNTLEMFATKTGAGVVYSHHYAKGNPGGKESIDRASGSGVFARDPDTIVNITALEDKDENTSYRVDMQLRCFKPIKPFGIRIVAGKVTLDSSLKINNIKKPGQFKPVYTENDILSHLAGKAYTTAELMEVVMQATEMSQSKFYELWRTVQKLDAVTQDKERRWTYVPPGSNPANN